MAVPATVASSAAAAAAAPASLYVGDLHPDVSDGLLFEAFTEFKSLSSVRVCRDSSSGRSLCYGYVNFVSPADATRAIETKNHTLLHGKVIRVAWSCRDPDARKNGKANVFVKNLADSVDNVGLKDVFKKFGEILSCKVAMSDDGKSRGHGFVQFDGEDSANAAIENLNGSDMGGKKIYVAKFVRKSDRGLLTADAKYTNLYVKNLDPEVTEEVLLEKFSEFGKVTSWVIAKNDDGTSRGFGFVNFENPDDAKKATETLNETQLGSKVLYVARAQKRSERSEILRRQFEERRKERILKYKDSNVYIKNIDDNVTDEHLREHFSQCGTIISAKVMRDDKGLSKGFGFVCFSTPEEANKAVNSFYGYMFHGKPLYVAIAQRKEERQAHLQIQYTHQIPGLAGASTAVIPGGYPLYYTAPSSLISQGTSRPSLMYQPIGLRPGWRSPGFPHPARPGFQPSSFPVIPSTPRENRNNRGRINGGIAQSAPHIPPLQQSTQYVASGKDSNNNQRGRNARYVPNGHSREANNGAGVTSSVPGSAGSGQQGTEMLSSMLAAASPEQQKQILGERLYPLVQKHKPDLVAKITGMLLEMDNSELLLLLESPESLTDKVDEAVEVLKHSKTKSSSQDSLHPSFLSAQVAVS
ncbi:polyadenylate-binding protein 7 [Eucalyptus grandis]|uniref:polyadenylate-binding protein 7 n=1 Tax=Eucalyptus grandis TaxID=71139 RepID=UPI00192E8D5C|nr:polyadenylate-binding protein 7 [Eucalyptus grandis]